MEIGDYVRTKYGIAKIINERTDRFVLDKSIIGDSDWLIADYNIIKDSPKMEELKSSPNIIDLIEVGDYVNGERVDDCIYLDKLGLIGLTELEKEDEKYIKSIVTKEQFESMEYKL